jgi:hypothetical protein
MTLDGLRRRIESGKGASIIYDKGNLQGLVSIWKTEDTIVMTWEECARGEQYDEFEYTRDERRTFETVDEVWRYVDECGLDPSTFTP